MGIGLQFQQPFYGIVYADYDRNRFESHSNSLILITKIPKIYKFKEFNKNLSKSLLPIFEYKSFVDLKT